MFYSGYFQAGRILSDGTIEKISFDAPAFAADPAILDAAPISDEQAWFLRRDVWFFDGKRTHRIETPGNAKIDSLGVAGSQVWIAGKDGKAPAIFRREGDTWVRVPFSIERFEHLSLTMGRDGVPYIHVTQDEPKPPARPGTVQTLEQRTKRTMWRWDGTRWNEITPPGYAFGIIPSTGGELYAMASHLEVQRFHGGHWSSVPLAPGAFVEKESERDPDRHWGVLPLSAHVDRSGRLWIAGVITMASPRDSGQFPGLWLLDGKAIRRVPLSREMKTDFLEVSSVDSGRDGWIWLATGTKVFRGRCS